MAIKVSSNTVIDDNRFFFPTNSSEVSTLTSITAGVLTIDLNSATVFEVTLNQNITSIVLSNVQPSGRSSSFVLITTSDGTPRAVTWPAGFRWQSNLAPSLTFENGKKDVFVFFTINGGTQWQSFTVGQNL